MKKILIVSFYELKDYLSHIKECFENYYFTVQHYPLYQYAFDPNDKISNYKEHMNNFIKDTNPDIILWWFIDVPYDVFKYIKQNNNNILYIMYNADDPININKNLFDKAKLFDIIITPCQESIYLYKIHSNNKTVIYGPMGFDPNIYYNINENYSMDKSLETYKTDYECDISMMCYNLYYDKDFYSPQIVYKVDFINNIINLCKKNSYKLKLYGVHTLQELFPGYYYGEVPYYKQNYLYNFSKINIVTSPFSNRSLYVSEYVMPILGSGGLLLHDNTKNINKLLSNGAVLYNDNNYLELIENILNNYNNYTHLKIFGNDISKNYTWEQWVTNIILEIGKMQFNSEIYSLLYNLDKNTDLFNYWCNVGIKNKEICWDFNVPNNFNHEEYVSNNNIIDNQKFAFYHWSVYSKNDLYMKGNGGTKNNIIPSDYNITMEDFFNIASIMNMVGSYKTRNEGIDKLKFYTKSIPYIKINEIISKYIDML